MDIEDKLKDLLEQLLIKLEVSYEKVKIEEDEKDNFSINIETDNPSLLIGYHGENMQALQHMLKVLAWRTMPNEKFNILLDIDGYRQRQEESVLKLAERKIESARRSGKPQVLPPMSPYFRRKIHLHCMGVGYDDIESYSEGHGERRQVVIKLKS